MWEEFSRKLGNIKKNQRDLKNTITEIIKNTTVWIKSGLDDKKEQISKLENRVGEII